MSALEQDHFQYAIEYLSPDGEVLGVHAFDPDWGPALEWASLRDLRLAGQAAPPSEGRVMPVWDEKAGAPAIAAARITTPGSAAHSVHGSNATGGPVADPHGGAAGIPVAASAADAPELDAATYFEAAARAGSAVMVEKGVLKKGDRYLFRVSAYARGQEVSPQQAGLVFDVEEASEPLRADARPLAPFTGATVYRQESASDELEVFIPDSVLEQCHDYARSAATVETGGIFVGKIHRATREAKLFLEITGMVPAAHTDAQSTQLTFTHESWKAVDDAIALRGGEELMCGWFHFHPRFCRRCAPEARAVCRFSKPFFSSEDVHMHRAVFPRAYQVALLVSDLGEPRYDASFFGWREGRVEARGFSVLGEVP